MNVVPFPVVRSKLALGRRIEPPAALGNATPPVADLPNDEDLLEERRRMQQNVAAFLLVLCLVLSGAWMIDRLMSYSRTLTCISTGHRACTLIDPRHLPVR